MKHIKCDFWIQSLGPWVYLGGGTEAKTFSEYGQNVYQIKGNDSCSKIVANISPLPDPRGGFKIQLL